MRRGRLLRAIGVWQQLNRHARVITRRLSDVLPNRLLNSRTECSVTLPLTAEALGCPYCQRFVWLLIDVLYIHKKIIRLP